MGCCLSNISHLIVIDFTCKCYSNNVNITRIYLVLKVDFKNLIQNSIGSFRGIPFFSFNSTHAIFTLSGCATDRICQSDAALLFDFFDEYQILPNDALVLGKRHIYSMYEKKCIVNGEYEMF